MTAAGAEKCAGAAVWKEGQTASTRLAPPMQTSDKRASTTWVLGKKASTVTVHTVPPMSSRGQRALL